MNTTASLAAHAVPSLRARLEARPRMAALLLFALYFTLWWLANSTAAGSVWWASDDFSHTHQFGVVHHIRQGRPLSALILALSTLEQGSTGPLMNVLLRTLQGATHVLTGLLAGAIFWRRTRSPVAWLAPLIWLLWPYNGEAALWRAAAIVPAAALLSVAGAWCVDRHLAGGGVRWLWGGVTLGIAAPLAHQHAAIAGIIVWVIALAAQHEPPGRRELVGLLWVAAAYAIGGAAGIIIAWMMSDFFASRGGFATDPGAKLEYLRSLIRNFLRDTYSIPVKLLQLALIAGGLVAIPLSALRSREGVGVMTLRLIAYASLFVLPFAPLLLPAENPLSARHYYAAPWLLVAAALLLDRELRSWRHGKAFVPVVVSMLLALYLPFALENGAEMVQIYHGDLGRLAAFASAIRAEQPDGPLTLIYADPLTAPVDWDIYDMTDWSKDSRTDLYTDAKGSAFLRPWAFAPFVRTHSEFAASIEADAVQKCATLCPLPETSGPLEFVLLPESQSVCLCPKF